MGHPISTYRTGGIKIWQLMLMVIISALAVIVSPVVSCIWMGLCIAVLYGFFKDRMEYIWYSIAASPAIEIWSRMASAPFIPYEAGKYFLLLCIVLLFIRQSYNRSSGKQYRIGGILLFVMLPGLLVGLAQFDFEQWVFNVLSIIELCLLLIIASRERWHIEQFCRALQISLVAIVCLTVYVSVKSPVFSDIEFSLKANASASGGFGSNQVSSILGVGIVLTSILLILNRPFFALKWLNYLLLIYFLFRGLLTFSRGGMVVAIIALIIAFVPKIFADTRSFLKYSGITALFLIMGTVVFIKINDMTGNMLLLRYEGETAGTYQGTKAKSLNTILSGRGDVVMSDMAMFKDNWVFGVSPGQSKLLRRSYGYDMDVAAHTEYTRLMSEQGIGGLIAAIAMFIFPVYWVRRQNISVWKGVIASLFTLALLTAVHAATRTNITVVYYVLAAMPVLYEARKYKKTPIADSSLYRQ